MLSPSAHRRAGGPGCGASAGSVSSQWRAIRRAARAEAASVLTPSPPPCDLIFDADPDPDRLRSPEVTSDACAEALLSLHRLLFHPWPCRNRHLPVVLHCAQRFLLRAALAAAAAGELTEEEGGRAGAAAQQLLAQSERERYGDARGCLVATR